MGVDEMIFIKALHFVVAHAAGHRRDMVDAGVGRHGVHRGVRIVCHELRAKMLLPDRDQIMILHRFSPLNSHSERACRFGSVIDASSRYPNIPLRPSDTSPLTRLPATQTNASI